VATICRLEKIASRVSETKDSTEVGRLFWIADASPFPSAAHRQCQYRPIACPMPHAPCPMPPSHASDALPNQASAFFSHADSHSHIEIPRFQVLPALAACRRFVSHVSQSTAVRPGICSRPCMRLSYRNNTSTVCHECALSSACLAPAAIFSCLAVFQRQRSAERM